MVATELKPKNDGESLKVAKVVLKRRDRNLAANAERAKTIQAMRKMRKSKPKTITAVHGDVLLKKAKCSKMDREHVIVSKVKRRFERQIPADAKCLLVARNERFPDFPRAKEALKKLALVPQNACRIITTSPENLERIRACDAYIFYGVPTPETVSTLVHKKAYMENPAKPQGEKKASSIPLNNNAVVEDTLGSHGLVCVEDLVEVLLKGRDNEELFNEVNKLIISFRVNPENRNPGSMFRNERASRGFVPKIETIMGRMV